MGCGSVDTGGFFRFRHVRPVQADRFSLEHTAANIGSDGMLQLELPAAGNAVFYRILGSAP